MWPKKKKRKKEKEKLHWVGLTTYLTLQKNRLRELEDSATEMRELEDIAIEMIQIKTQRGEKGRSGERASWNNMKHLRLM